MAERKQNLTELARAIRTEKAFLTAYLEFCARADNRLSDPRRLRIALQHRERLRRLLLNSQRLCKTKRAWRHWLQDECLMHERRAIHYLEIH